MKPGAVPKVHPAVWTSWRTGRKVGRTIYMQFGPEPDDGDLLIGMMDSAEIAQAAVDAHNASLRR